jgi:hypothetical protein
MGCYYSDAAHVNALANSLAEKQAKESYACPKADYIRYCREWALSFNTAVAEVLSGFLFEDDWDNDIPF